MRHEVYRCATITEIADFMNDEGDRYFGWNFVILYEPSGTVEFRRGPDVTTVRGCNA